jgi:hypothetical protein
VAGTGDGGRGTQIHIIQVQWSTWEGHARDSHLTRSMVSFVFCHQGPCQYTRGYQALKHDFNKTVYYCVCHTSQQSQVQSHSGDGGKTSNDAKPWCSSATGVVWAPVLCDTSSLWHQMHFNNGHVRMWHTNLAQPTDPRLICTCWVWDKLSEVLSNICSPKFWCPQKKKSPQFLSGCWMFKITIKYILDLSQELKNLKFFKLPWIYLYIMCLYGHMYIMVNGESNII